MSTYGEVDRLSREHELKWSVLRAVIDSVVVGVGTYMGVVVPIALVTPHIEAEHTQDRPIENYVFPLVCRW